MIIINCPNLCFITLKVNAGLFWAPLSRLVLCQLDRRHSNWEDEISNNKTPIPYWVVYKPVRHFNLFNNWSGRAQFTVGGCYSQKSSSESCNKTGWINHGKKLFMASALSSNLSSCPNILQWWTMIWDL